MSVRTVMLLAAVLTHQLHAQDTEETDDTELLQYIVALITDVTYCYGTLISPNWVLTAANCLTAVSVQYGDLSIPLNETTTIRKILFSERPRSTKIHNPDLGMVFITSVPLQYFGKLSAVDYKAMAGHIIKYTDLSSPQSCEIREGVVISCNVEKKSALSSHLCIAPKCSAKKKQSLRGNPGSPLFYDRKLAGVHVAESVLDPLRDTKKYAMRTYTPISPYLSWINEVMRTKEFVTFL